MRLQMFGRGSAARTSLLILVWLIGLVSATAGLSGLVGDVSASGQTAPQTLEQPPPAPRVDTDNHGPHPLHEIDDAMVRLPLAALLGAALALRPRRRGTPKRTAPVVQTQIILAVVGAVIMLVVGASLARAFGIVGAANLIRYRSKIEDPKDAVVMLCALAVGLATGVGLYGLAIVGTLFIVFCLWIIEGFEPQTRVRSEERRV